MTSQTAARSEHTFSLAQQRIFDSMVELLRRVGLEYQGRFVDAGGYRIHYLDYGSGPTVLLLHGGGAGGAMWFRQIAELSKRFRVIAPDNPIFGLSSRPARVLAIPEVTTGFVESFLDALGIEKVHLAGLSMGGFAAARFAGENPERVERLALLDSAGFGRDLPWGFRLSSLPVLKYLLTRPQRWLHEKFFAAVEVVHADTEHNDAYLRYAFEVTRNDGHSIAVRQNMPVFAGIRGQRNLFSDEELATIRTETLVIWGEKDRFFPLPHARRAASLIPDSKLVVLPDSGHVIPLDQPEEVNRLLSDFFESP